MATTVCRFGTNICGSSAWNLLHVAILVPKSLSWLLDFFESLYTPASNCCGVFDPIKILVSAPLSIYGSYCVGL